MSVTNDTSKFCSNNETDILFTAEKISFHIYLFIFCLLVLIFGISGNATVLYIYTRRLNILIFGFFIKVLAVFDIITTCIAIPFILIFRLAPYLMDNDIMCKVLTFIKHLNAMNAGIIFIIIAVQRFRKICRIHKGQLTENLAKKLILLSVGLSIAGSIPIIFFLGERHILVEWNNQNVTVAICDFTMHTKSGLWATLYTVWVSVELVGITSTLVILYIFIARALKTHVGKRSESFRPGTSVRGRKQTSTIIFFVITVIFLITSSPMVIVSMYFSLETVDCQWSYAGITMYDLSVNLLFINCVVNPIVYSFNSTVFRRECKAVLRSLTSRRKHGNTDNSQIQTSPQPSGHMTLTTM